MGCLSKYGSPTPSLGIQDPIPGRAVCFLRGRASLVSGLREGGAVGASPHSWEGADTRRSMLVNPAAMFYFNDSFALGGMDVLNKVSVCWDHGFNVSEFMIVDWLYGRESKYTGVRNVKLCVHVEEAPY